MALLYFFDWTAFAREFGLTNSGEQRFEPATDHELAIPRCHECYAKPFPCMRLMRGYVDWPIVQREKLEIAFCVWEQWRNRG